MLRFSNGDLKETDRSRGAFTDWKVRAPFFIFICLMLWLYGWIPHEELPYAQWDLAQYTRMAEAAPGVAGEVPRPFAFRVLGPWLAGLLPVSIPAGFRVLSILASLALPFQFEGLLRQQGIDLRWGLFVAMLFVCNRYLFGFSVWNGFQLNDILALNLLMVSLSCMWRRAWMGFGFSLVAGVLAREVALLMLPVLGVWLWEQKTPPGAWIRPAMACLPALGVFLLLRIFVPAQGGRDLAEAFSSHAPKLLSLEIPLRLWVNAFLPFSFFPLLFPKHTLRFIRQHPHLVFLFLLVSLSTLFGTNNERLMAPAFVVVYFLLARILQDITPPVSVRVMLGTAAFLNSFHHLYGRYPLPDRTWTITISLATTLVVTALGARTFLSVKAS